MFPQIFGKYVLEREMARGGMARVFLATLRGAGGFEKRLVVKQIRPELASDEEFVRRFVAEAKMAVSLSHPNIVPVYELGVEQGIYYIAMELCEGVTLAELLQCRGVLTAPEGAYLGVEICRALDYAHRRHVVHRDVTPGNVMVDAEGAVRVIDFGIAGSVAPSGQPGSQVFGSLGHMSPEHLAGEQVGPAGDVFAVGTVLIEAWTGKAPFRRDTIEQVRAAIAEPQAKLSESNPLLQPLDDLLRSTVGISAEERPRSAEDLSRPLRQFLKTADVGDVARRLGRGVASMLADRMSQPQPSEEAVDADEDRPKSNGHTRTFAAQPQFAEWTRPLTTVGQTGENPQHLSAKILDGSQAKRGASFRDRVIPVAAFAGFTAAVIVWWAFNEINHEVSHQSTVRDQPIEQLSLPSPVQPASSSAALPSAALPVPLVSTPNGATGGERTEPVRSSGQSSTSQMVNPPVISKASLTLSAQPACDVFIDGKLLGRTPVRALSLLSGSHRVEFKSTLMDEMLGTSIELHQGEHRQLHADFTAATPRLIFP